MTPDLDEHGYPKMTPERTDAIRQTLLNVIRNEPLAKARRLRKRFAIWGAVGLLAAGGAAVAATAVIQSRAVSNHNIVHCLASPERDANGKFDESSATLGRAGKPGRVDDAIALCSEMWRQGVFAKKFDPLSPSNAPAAVPSDLRVCVMEDGSAAVVPGKANVCMSLGLAPLKD